MPQPDQVVAAHYEAQARQAEATVILARRQWRRLGIADFDGDWARIVAQLTSLVRDGQLGAARAGAAYVPLALGEAGYDEAAAGTVGARQLSGTASDGRPLDTLLYGSVVHLKEALGRGATVPQAFATGRKWLDLNVRTQVADAGRGAAGVAVAARPHVAYERMVSPPCCQRCAVLAGKRFRWNQGFLRHARCDCRHSPVDERDSGLYTAQVEPDQIRDLTVAQRRAIADGADANQVINAHRKGARSADGMTTTEGTTRRGLAGQRTSGKRRLTPDAIYRLSASRNEALDLLRRYGYLL